MPADSVVERPMDKPAGRYRVNVPLRWSDMDAYGHVNNVQFLRLLEDARVIGFEDWFGQDRSVLAEGILVARHEIEYLAPLLFRVPPIVVEMWATRIGGAGFDLAYEVRDGNGQGDAVYARAETTLVLYDFDQLKPRRMDQALRGVLEGHAGEPVPFRWRRR
jgi:acyl-CoA thioester hydrolase